MCVCVCVTSEQHALTEVAAHVVHADGLNSKQVENIRRNWRYDGLLQRRKDWLYWDGEG